MAIFTSIKTSTYRVLPQDLEKLLAKLCENRVQFQVRWHFYHYAEGVSAIEFALVTAPLRCRLIMAEYGEPLP